MDQPLWISIPGKPLAQKRHRSSKGKRYDPSATDKKNIRKHYLYAWSPIKPLSGFVGVTIIAYFRTPKSWSEKKRQEMEGSFRIGTPDVDNIFKIYTDAMNNFILKDDAQIVRSAVEKRYSMNPRVEIDVREL